MKKWRTLSGDELDISEMETSHIKNCIKFIEERNTRQEYLPYFKEELERRGLFLTGDNLKDFIPQEQQIYFLETSCEYEIIKQKEFRDILSSDPKYIKLMDWITKEKKISLWLDNNSFVVKGKSKEDTINELLEDLENCSKVKKRTIYENYKIYSKWESRLVINVFSKEWSRFISMMLGYEQGAKVLDERK